MIITFKSRAAGDVIMFGDVAKSMLKIMGKDPEDRQGIVTVEQLPDAISRLRRAIDEDKAKRQAQADDEDDEAGRNRVSLTQRAVPLLELLQYSLRDEQPVTWGV